MSQRLREKRFETLFKINIDEGGGGEIASNLAFITCFATGLIAPMFFWILATPKKNKPIVDFCEGTFKKNHAFREILCRIRKV